MDILLMGAQGSGKGTQAEAIIPRYHLVLVATGDLFRAAIASGSELGQAIKGTYDRGELVSDEITLQLVKQRLQEIAAQQASGQNIGGALFDGFPRSKPQADGLDTVLAEMGERVTTVIYLNVPYEVLVERLAGRWICPVCGRAYNVVTNPPKTPGRCDVDGTALIQRADDTPEAIRKRLDLYFQQTAPLIESYRQRGLLTEIDGNRSIEEVRADIFAAIDRAATATPGAGSHADRS